MVHWRRGLWEAKSAKGIVQKELQPYVDDGGGGGGGGDGDDNESNDYGDDADML